jgi:hypothetical protein
LPHCTGVLEPEGHVLCSSRIPGQSRLARGQPHVLSPWVQQDPWLGGLGLPPVEVPVWEGLAPLQEGPSGGEPPEKERRRLKESFENYRRWAGGQAGRRAGGQAGRRAGGAACGQPGPPAHAPPHPTGSGRSGRCRTAGGRARGTAATPPAATTRTPRAPSSSGLPAWGLRRPSQAFAPWLT